MKKVLVVAVAGLFILASCKKEYSCECKWSGGSLDGQTTTLKSQTKISKKDAQAWCDENNSTSTSSTITCTLK